MRVVRLLLCLPFLLSCAHSSTTYHYQPSVQEAVDPSFVFATFKIRKDTSDRSIVELLDMKKVSGSLKLPQGTVNQESYLTFRQVSSLGESLSEVYIEHPLLRTVEYTTPQGTFQQKSVTLSEAEFFVRSPLADGTTVIEILETIGSVKTQIFKTSFTR